MLHGIEGVDDDHIYFAPEKKNNMEYPCIRYDLSDRNADNADDDKYIKRSVYNITYITRKPSEAIKVCNQLENLRFCNFVRPYVTDGLYHYVYTITI
jgi:hypothetical protein